MRTLAELTQPDERSLRFTPIGFSTGGLMRPEAAAAHIQHSTAVELASSVPETTRRSFERVRETHLYGLFSYELFTVSEDQSLLVLEQALAERFVAYYEGRIPLVNSQGQQSPLEVRTFDQVYDALNKTAGSHRKGKWYVESLANPGLKLEFKGTFSQLFGWARQERLLHGQRSRLHDKMLVEIRNAAVHPSTYHLSMPNYAARRIRDVGEITNRIWGAPTAGGRIFPAPIQREIFAVAWDPNGTGVIRTWADQVGNDTDHRSWPHIVVSALEADDLWSFDADFETTRYPADLLWGPGAWTDAVTWLAQYRPPTDHVDYLDRWFVVRIRNGGVDYPRNPGGFAGLPPADRDGNWLLMQADFPEDAYAHARGYAAASGNCGAAGQCDSCWVDVRAAGDWESVLTLARNLGLGQSARAPIGVRVPFEFGYWR